MSYLIDGKTYNQKMFNTSCSILNLKCLSSKCESIHNGRKKNVTSFYLNFHFSLAFLKSLTERNFI